MIARRVVCVAALLIVPALARRLTAECPAGTWVSLAPMAEPRQELAAAELGGRIYVGGIAGRANANTIYDPVRDAWTVGADLPVTTDHAWAVSLEGRLYVGGGSGNRVFRYDPDADLWMEVASSTFVHAGVGRTGISFQAGGGDLLRASQPDLEAAGPRNRRMAQRRQ